MQIVRRPIAEYRDPFLCPVDDCGAIAQQIISPVFSRVEDYENIGKERGGDCAGEFIGLPDKKISLGKDSTGTERFRYEPVTTGDIRNRREFLDAAKRAGLSPGDGGRFRTVGR